MHCIPLWHVPIDFDTSLTGERPTAQELQSLIWKDGVTTKEVRIMDEVKSRWREFGVALGFSIGDLDAIRGGRIEKAWSLHPKSFRRMVKKENRNLSLEWTY